jgi:hypothetical protein
MALKDRTLHLKSASSDILKAILWALFNSALLHKASSWNINTYTLIGILGVLHKPLYNMLDGIVPSPHPAAAFWINVHETVRKKSADLVAQLPPEDQERVRNADRHPVDETQIYKYLVIRQAGILGEPRQPHPYLSVLDIHQMEEFLQPLGEVQIFYRALIYSVAGRSVLPQGLPERIGLQHMQVLVCGTWGIGKTEKLFKRIPRIFNVTPIDFDAELEKKGNLIERDRRSYTYHSQPAMQETASQENVLIRAMQLNGVTNPLVNINELAAASNQSAGYQNYVKEQEQKRLYDPMNKGGDQFEDLIIFASTNVAPDHLNKRTKDTFLVFEDPPPTISDHRKLRTDIYDALSNPDLQETEKKSSRYEKPSDTEAMARSIEFSRAMTDVADFLKKKDAHIGEISGNSYRLPKKLIEYLMFLYLVHRALYKKTIPDDDVDRFIGLAARYNIVDEEPSDRV